MSGTSGKQPAIRGNHAAGYPSTWRQGQTGQGQVPAKPRRKTQPEQQPKPKRAAELPHMTDTAIVTPAPAEKKAIPQTIPAFDEEPEEEPEETPDYLKDFEQAVFQTVISDEDFEDEEYDEDADEAEDDDTDPMFRF